jgi:hypothetical protein
MTKRERAQVVELLRCAADLCAIDSSHGLYSVAHLLGHDTWDTTPITGRPCLIWKIACEARNQVHRNGLWWGYWHECLEAAARIDEESALLSALLAEAPWLALPAVLEHRLANPDGCELTDDRRVDRYTPAAQRGGGLDVGLFDYVECDRPEFVCTEGHDLRGEEFQTKDLGETMGSAHIGDRLDLRDGGWGESMSRPFSGTIEVYANCRRCPAFVQAETFNTHPVGVMFDVEIADDVVVKVTRTGKTSAEQLAEAPTLDYMPGCRGPMSYEDAKRRQMDRKFFPWDPVPVVDDETKERQRAWRERIDSWRNNSPRKPRT